MMRAFQTIKAWFTDGVPPKPLERGRSPKWALVRSRFIVKNPCCAGCGTKENLEVHHKKPFHLSPELELSEDNLIVLCEKPGRNCHYRLGHSFNWRAYNPFVVDDAALSLKRVQERLTA